jgi:branched-subunit amino acid ABC-type transport system permease component
MQIRAGEADREMIAALGVDIRFLYTVVFALGAALAVLPARWSAPSSRFRSAWANRF